MTVEAMTTNLPACCVDCSHYRGEPSYDCALVNRSMLNAETKRPFWCPLADAFFKMPGIDRSRALPSEAGHRWIVENSDIVEALSSGAWKAVPVEPTEKMLDALWNTYEFKEGWAAMLAAAPAKPGDENDR